MASKGKTPATTTLADLMAAAALGTIDPTTTVVIPGAEPQDGQPETAPRIPVRSAPLSASEHECGIAGCRHGAAHSGNVQPDRQVKLQCPACGAVARMTAGALAKSGGTIVCGGDNQAFAEAARRTYSRKSA